jgi:hypothetical protein
MAAPHVITVAVMTIAVRHGRDVRRRLLLLLGKRWQCRDGEDE